MEKWNWNWWFVSKCNCKKKKSYSFRWPLQHRQRLFCLCPNQSGPSVFQLVDEHVAMIYQFRHFVYSWMIRGEVLMPPSANQNPLPNHCRPMHLLNRRGTNALSNKRIKSSKCYELTLICTACYRFHLNDQLNSVLIAMMRQCPGRMLAHCVSALMLDDSKRFVVLCLRLDFDFHKLAPLDLPFQVDSICVRKEKKEKWTCCYVGAQILCRYAAVLPHKLKKCSAFWRTTCAAHLVDTTMHHCVVHAWSQMSYKQKQTG